MIFFEDVEVTEPGFECTRKVAIFVRLEIDGVTQCADTATLMQDVSLLKTMEHMGVYLKIAKLPNFALPVLVLDETLEQNTSQLRPVGSLAPALYGMFDKAGGTNLGDSALAQIKQIVLNAIGDETLTVQLISACISQYTWEHASEISATLPTDISLFDNDFFVPTNDAVAELNKPFMSGTGNIVGGDNNTRKQVSCTDELFIRLPTAAQLADESVKNSDLIPRREELCDPYLADIYYTPDYDNVVPKSSPERKMIEGSDSNNGKPIYPNEQRFYDALVTWTTFNINENPRLRGGTVIDAVSKNFFNDLISRLYIYFWGHNPHVPVAILDTDDDDDSDSMGSKYFFRGNEGDGINAIQSNAVQDLLEFVEAASLKVGYTAYLDTIIQICRWGERKPTCIVIQGYDRSFSLGDNTEHTLFSVTGEVHRSQIDGCDYEPICLIFDDTAIANGQVTINNESLKSWRMPTGLLLRSVYVDDAGTEFSVKTAISMIDLIREIINNGTVVSGIDFSNRVFSAVEISGEITTSEVMKLESKEEQLAPFIYRSTPLTNLMMSVGSSSATNTFAGVNQFSIMKSRLQLSTARKDFGEFTFTDLAGFKDVMDRHCVSAAAALSVRIAAMLCPVYETVAAEYSDAWSLSDVMNAWYHAMVYNSYVDEAAFYNDGKFSEAAIPAVAEVIKNRVQSERLEQKDAQAMSSFDQSATQNGITAGSETSTAAGKPVTKSESTAGVNIFMQIPSECIFAPVTNGDRRVGLCAVTMFPMTLPNGQTKRFKRYVVISEETAKTIPAARLSDQSVDLKLLIAHAINLLTVVGGSTSPQQLFFENQIAIKELREIYRLA